MKRVFVLLVVLCSIHVAKGQNNNVVSAINYLEKGWLQDKDTAALLKARARIDTAARHPDTKEKCKTWFYRGKIYHAIFDMNLARIVTKIQETDLSKKNMIAYQTVNVNDLETAIVSYKKELELDTKDDWSGDAKKYLKVCVDDYAYKAYAMYFGKKYEEALPLAEKSYELSLKNAGKTDTNSLNIAAFCAGRTKQYDKAISLYEQLIGIKYQPVNCYTYLIELYKQKGDEPGLKACIAKARTAFPNEYVFIVEDLNMAIKEGKIADAINSLNLAIEKDPKNAELHLVLGQTYQKMAFADPKPANFDELVKKAEEQFKSATDLKTDYFNAYYNYGVFYSNWGASILNASQKLTDMSKMNAEEKKANDLFLKAIPLLERSLEINKTDKDAMRALKQLYAKTGQADTDKYKKLNDMLKN